MYNGTHYLQVEDLRYQVRALQAVAGYGAPADGDNGDAANGEAGSGGRGSTSSSSLEALLVDKARRLEHELTMARLQLAEAQGEAAGVRCCTVAMHGKQRQVPISMIYDTACSTNEQLATAAGSSIHLALW